MLYGTLDFNLSDNTTVNVGYSYFQSFTNMVWGGIPIMSDGHHAEVPRSTFIGADWEYLNQDVKTIYASVEHEFNNGWNVRLNAKYGNTVSEVLATWVVSEEDSSGYGHIYWAAEDDTNQFGADLFVSGPVNLFGRSHELVFGMSTNKEDVKNVEFFNCFNTSCALSSFLNAGSWDPSAATKPALTLDSPDRYGGTSSVSQKSTYSAARWDLSDSLKLITGVRLDWYENVGGWSDTKESANPTLYGGVIYDINQNHSFYTSYTDIFKPQSDIDINRNVLEPVVGKNYEVGIKGEYFDQMLNTSVALFRIDQANLAKRLADQSPCPTFPGTSCYEATGLVRSEGVDIEIQGRLSLNWEVGAGYTYSHVEYVKDADVERIGERTDTGIPENLFKMNTTYMLPGGLDAWRIGAGLTYQSRIYYDLDTGTEIIRNQQKSHTLVNLMISYSPVDQVSVQAHVSNLFDKTYYHAIADDIFYGSTEMYGTPRNFMLTLRYDW